MAANSYYNSLLQKQTDLGEILLKMARELESINYKESFHGAFSSANAAIDLIAQRIEQFSQSIWISLPLICSFWFDLVIIQSCIFIGIITLIPGKCSGIGHFTESCDLITMVLFLSLLKRKWISNGFFSVRLGNSLSCQYFTNDQLLISRILSRTSLHRMNQNFSPTILKEKREVNLVFSLKHEN